MKRTFGEDRVFVDVRDVDAGDEYPPVLQESLRQAAVLIVLIGTGWLHVQDKYGRRRLDKGDWVRSEIRTGLQRQSCKVIPVLIDDAELPAEREALPEDIEGLLTRQRIRIRQTNSDNDIETLSREVAKTGFLPFHDYTEPFGGQEFSDKVVLDVVTLRKLQEREGTELVSRRELLRELDRLFNRKTFRFEALRECTEQRWAGRLDSAYQTEKALRI